MIMLHIYVNIEKAKNLRHNYNFFKSCLETGMSQCVIFYSECFYLFTLFTNLLIWTGFFFQFSFTLCLIRLITEQYDYLRVSWKDVVHQALVAWLQSRNTATTTWAYTSMWKLLHFIHVLQKEIFYYMYISSLKSVEV